MRKKLRRVAILVLVLVLLCNTLGVNASTGQKQEPKITVSSYGELYTAYAEAQSGDVIGVRGTIVIPTLVSLEKYITFRRMEAGAKLIFRDDYNSGSTGNITYINFDGNANEVSGTEPFAVVNGNVTFKMCDFSECLNYGDNGNGGALYIESGEVTLNGCGFESNSAYNGSHIYNNGTLTVSTSTFKDGWADEMGGAIYNAGRANLNNAEIKENNARTGGGIYNSSYLEIYNSLVWNNTDTRQGADIANEGTYINKTTDEQYNSLLSEYRLYFNGWEDDTNPSIGGAGDYLKFLTTEEEPNAPVVPEPTDPEPTEPVEPTEPTDPTEPTTPTDPEPTEPTDPQEPTTEEPTTEEPSTEDPKPSTPSDAGEGGSGGSSTDNSQSSSNSTTDNGSSSSVSNVDNSSNRSDSSKVENSHKTSNNTTNNYTTTQPAPIIQPAPATQESKVDERVIYVTVPASQSSNSTEVGSNATKATESPTEAPSELTAGQDLPVNLKLDIQGANVVYEQGEDGYNISISYSQPQTITDPQVATGSTQPVEQENKPNWVEVVTMILLLVLVLGEVKDKLRKQPE